MKSIFACAALVVSSLSYSLSIAWAEPQVSSVWQVESEMNTIYIAAGVSILREVDLPLPPQFKQAFGVSDRLVFEVDPRESNDEAEGEKAIMMGMFTDGGSIEDKLSEEAYEALGDFLSGSGAPRRGMDQFRPWFASIMITMTEMMKEGMRPDLGVANIIGGWAAVEGTPVSGLESAQVELELLAALPEEVHQHMLEVALEEAGETERVKREFEIFIKAWREGDLEKMRELDAEDQTEWDEVINRKLYRERADTWMGQFKDVLAGERATMYVIGIGHLLGDGNLLEKLKEEGYKVKPLKLSKQKKKRKDRERKGKKKPALIPVSLP